MSKGWRIPVTIEDDLECCQCEVCGVFFPEDMALLDEVPEGWDWKVYCPDCYDRRDTNDK